MTDLTFYTNPQSRGRIIRWMLEEVGAPYETVALDYATTMHGDEYRAINPMMKVPAIRHGDAVVTECAAICAYLAEAFPAAGLDPTADERAAYYRWLFFAAGPIEAAATNQAMGVVPPADKQGMVGYGTLERAAEVLDGRVAASPYIAGDRFTAADVYVGAQIGWLTQFGLLPSTPAFTEYLARVQARPAWKRATEKDDALVAEMADETA